jgi:hypothetical protein
MLVLLLIQYIPHLAIAATLIIFGYFIAGIFYIGDCYMSSFEKKITIKRKDTQIIDSQTCYLVIDTDNNQYHLGAECSSETYYQLIEGEIYKVKGSGRRDKVNNKYPIICSCEQVK